MAAPDLDRLQAMDAGAKPLQIVRLDMRENRIEVDEANLKVVGDNLRSSGADAVSILAIMGTYRTGKSFLLDLLLRYLRCWERSDVVNARWEEKRAAAYREAEWKARMVDKLSPEKAQAAGAEAAEKAVKDLPKMAFPDEPDPTWRCKGSTRLPPPSWLKEVNASKTFEWRGGMDKCTEGIWLWSRPFVVLHEGRKVGVLLMDTQGAWDGVMTKEQNASIFGLTALLSSKLICNVQNMLSDEKIDAIDYFTTFAQATCTGFSPEGQPFGDLEFLIRDWAWYNQEASFQDCSEVMEKHLQQLLNSNVQGRAELRERLSKTFRSISSFGLPHPGMSVLEPGFKGDLEDISSDFLQLLGEFTRTCFNPKHFPRPSAPVGIEISPAFFENTVRNFVESFKMTGGNAVHLREAFVKCEIFTTRDALMQLFKQRLERAAPESRVVDPVDFEAHEASIRRDLHSDFKAKIGTFKVPDEAKQIRDFMDIIGEALDRRRAENNSELEVAQFKLLASPLVGMSVFFALGHPFMDAIFVAMLMWLQAERSKKRLGKQALDVDVLRSMGGDVVHFSKQRGRDLQAMQIAAQTCTPTAALAVLNKAGATAVAVAAATQRAS